MVAAHMNNIAAITKLLKAGANINQKTTMPTVRYTSYRLKYHGRTALMYAAENASSDVIKLLIENGADASIKDVSRYEPSRDILTYLSLNQLITPDERADLEELVTQKMN